MKRASNKKSARGPQPGSATFSKIILFTSGMLLMFLFDSLFWPGRGLAWRQMKITTAHASSSASATNFPWGARIEYVPLALDRPEEYFTNDIGSRPIAVWTFRGQTQSQLGALFTGLDLTDSTRAWLADWSHWDVAADTFRTKPPPEVVLSLNPDTRARLYAMLARHPENIPQAAPFQFRSDGFDDWFSECGLPKEKLALVRKLTYQQDGNLCFADAATFAQISAPDETKYLIRSLWRVSTFKMKLRIDPTTDVSAVMKYWGLLGPAYTYRPLIDSLSRVSEGSFINVSYFLPPFPRLRLYTYPNPGEPNIIRQDCFWSSMNFFNTAPDNGFFDSDYTQKVLKQDFAREPAGQHQFGDLLLLLGKNNEALHMCVYIADDVVFTKNGANTQQPWVLMKLSEMLGSYKANKPFQIVTYRRKLPPTAAMSEFSSAPRRM